MDKHRRHSEAEFIGFDESERGKGEGEKRRWDGRERGFGEERMGLRVRCGDKRKGGREEEHMQIFD